MPAIPVAVGRFGLELDNVFAGWVRSVEGGNAFAEVVTEPTLPGRVGKKHTSAVQYADLVLTVGMDLKPAFYNWLRDAAQGNPKTRNGAIIAVDAEGIEKSRLSFTNGLISEISFPALDASSKKAGALTVRITPEQTKRTTGSGAVHNQPETAGKKWISAHFRLSIDGVDCTRVTRVDGFTIKMPTSLEEFGAQRVGKPVANRVEIPNLTAVLSEAGRKSFDEWFDDFVVKGNNADNEEKSGSLTLLTPDLKKELMTVGLNHIGIIQVANEKLEATSQNRRVRAEFYCEQMALEYKAEGDN